VAAYCLHCQEGHYGSISVARELERGVRRITEEEEAVRSARQLEEDLANEAKAQVNVCGGVMAAAETDDPDPAPMDVRDIDSTSTLSVQFPARAAGERPLGKDDFTIGEVVRYSSAQGCAKFKNRLATVVRLLIGQVEISLNGPEFQGLKPKKVQYTSVLKQQVGEKYLLEQETLPAPGVVEGATMRDVPGDSNDPSVKDETDLLLLSLYGDLGDLD